MNYEEKIKELTERIEFLEKKEHTRIIKRRIEITFKLIKLLIIIILLFKVYTYIKPYKEKIDNIENKVDTVENYVKDKWNNISKYNPFTKKDLEP